MISRRVEFGYTKHLKNDMPKWAVNFLKEDDLFSLLEYVYMVKRNEVFPMFCAEKGKLHLLERVKFNKRGDLVFFWDNKAEMHFFIKVWDEK